MTLREFVEQFGDADPWSVPVRVWYHRVNVSGGLPDKYWLLVDEYNRAQNIDQLEEVFGPFVPAAPDDPDDGAERTRSRPKADQLSTKVGTVLRRRRIARRIRLREAARATGIHPSALCRIEQGERPISLDEMSRLAVFLECRLEAVIHQAVSLDLET